MGGVEWEQAHTVALGFTSSQQPMCDGVGAGGDRSGLPSQAGLQKLLEMFFEHSNMNSSCQNPRL